MAEMNVKSNKIQRYSEKVFTHHKTHSAKALFDYDEYEYVQLP